MKNILFVFMIFGVFSLGGCDAPGSQKIAQLEKNCKKLTEETGIEHKVISGQYIPKESYVMTVSSNSSGEWGYTITIKSNDAIIRVYNPFFPNKKNSQDTEVHRAIKRVFGEQGLPNYKNKEDSDFYVGICIKNIRNDASGFGVIETFTNLEKGKNNDKYK